MRFLKKILYKVYIEKVNGLDLTKEIIEYLGCKVDIENIKDSRYIYIYIYFHVDKIKDILHI